MRNHVIDELIRLGKYNQKIMLVTADLGFNVVEGFQNAYPNRYINVGISEQNMASISAGLALEGNMVFTYSIGNFPTLRCIEQIRNLICYHHANVKILAVGGGFAYGSLGMTHHATEDIAMMRALPNMKVYVPADAIEAVACLHEMCKYDGPCYLRMARGKEPNLHEWPVQNIIDVNHILPIIEEGADVVFLTTGTILSEAIKIQSKLKGCNIKSSVYSIPSIKPVDKEKIISLATTVKLLVTMEEHNIIGGLGGVVAEILSGLRNHAPLLRLGLNDTFTQKVGNQEYLRECYDLSCDKVLEKVMEFLEREKVL